MQPSFDMKLLYFSFFFIFACKEKPKTSKYGCVKSIFDEAPNQVMSFAFKSNSEIYKLMDIDSTKDTLSFGYKKQLIYYKQNNVKANLDFVILSKKDKSISRFSPSFIKSPFIKNKL